MPIGEDETSNRKLNHIRMVLSGDVDYDITTMFEDIILIHNSLPEISLEKIDTKTKIFGRTFNLPILIDSMTGGTKIAKKINENLALAAGEVNIPVSCGSQRAAIENPDLTDTYRVMRDVGNNIFIIANIGAQQLIPDPLNIANSVIDMIDADALAIHLNPLQEATQLNGDVNLKGCLEAIREVVENVNVPIIVKETGAGISRETAVKLRDIGVDAINISGAGGTSWSAVEIERLNSLSEDYKYEVSKIYKNWGIPTAASLIEVARSVDIPIIASGGIRTGLDIAKSIAVGASFTGIAKPFLSKALEGRDSVIKYINILRDQLKVAMLLTGSINIFQLKRAKYVILGRLREWLSWRGVI